MSRPDEIPQLDIETSLLLEAEAPRISAAGVVLVTAALVVVLLLSLDRLNLCAWSSVCGPLLAEDIGQGRLDSALPAPQTGFHLEQTFIPRHNGLTEVEVMLVQYGGAMPPGGDSTLALELVDRTGMPVATQTLKTGELSHNQIYSLSFPPQPASAGQSYALRLSGSEQNHFSTWGYSLDVYQGGELRLVSDIPGIEVPVLPARELRFITRYALTAGDLAAAASLPLRDWPLTLAAFLLLPLPGVLLLLLVHPRGWDPAAWLGVTLALGAAAWPILWQWLSLVGANWSGLILWAAVAGGWAAALALAVIGRRRQTTDRRQPLAVHRPAIAGCYLLLATLLLATTATRFIAIRDMAFPPWVDSSRHALITAVMVESGQTPTGYEPFLPVDHFPYHFGFHTLAASLRLMTGRPLPELLLYLMQLLGGLLPLTVYAAGYLVTRRRAIGLLAAFLVALPFFFPGYYATWGRMTQLTAMLVMPPLLALTWRLGRGWPRFWPLVGVLAAGLFLLHFRVFLFYLPFAGLAAIYHWLGYRRVGALVRAGVVGAILVLPRLVDLLRVTDPARTIRQSLPGYNDFPTGYLTTGWERVYLVLAAVGLAVLVAGVAMRRRWAAFPSLLVLWVAVLFGLLAGDRLGLPESLVVNLNSMYITLFLPLALFLAAIAGRVWAGLGRHTAVSSPWALAGGPLCVLAGVSIGLLTLFGLRQQANIINPQTILALPEDALALDWVEDNLPPDARIAVNAWKWLGETWAGADGGAWIVPLTGRETTTPPVDYIYNRDLFLEVQTFNTAASAVEDWGNPASADWLAEQGVSHVFVGRRGGYFDPAELSRNPGLSLLYQRDGAFIFAVR